MFAGALLDAWSHVHVPALDPVWSPWHWPVYGSFLVLLGALAIPVARRLASGRDINSSIPGSYRLPVVGGVVFALAGIGDLAWHAAFGVEVGVEALLSPTHLGLAVGAGLLWTLPVRIAWRRRRPPRSVLAMAPTLVCIALLVGLASFTTHFAHPLVDPWPQYAFDQTDVRSWFVPSLGFSAVVIQTAILIGAALLLVRRWPDLPTGALTLLFVISSSGLAFLHDAPALLIVPAVTGFVADALRALLRPGLTRPGHVLAFAAAVPATQTLVYLATIEATAAVRWSIHLVGGLVAISALVGLAISLLVFPPWPNFVPRTEE